MSHDPPAPGLPKHLRALLEPGAYPHAVDRVELIETHVSWVLLAGEFAYKLKRPVCYAFVDLRSAERRRFFCEEELRLNRRFAPQLYLGVTDITASEGGARIGGEGPVLECAVRMRRFCGSDELDQLLDSLHIEPLELEAFGRTLAGIHDRLPAAPASSPWGEPTHVQGLIERNLEECALAARVLLREAAVRELRPAIERWLRALGAWLAERRRSGRVRECHGDLHCRNLVRLRGALVPFDCLEFEPAFRWIDVADEIATLTSDLNVRRRPRHAHAFRSGYLAQSGDYAACRGLRLYEAHRALVRAKVEALTAAAAPEGDARRASFESFERRVECARATLDPRQPLLLMMCGLSGSGKTWQARLLAPRLDAVHLRSDVERKRRAGLGEFAHSGSAPGENLYTPERDATVYEDLAQDAQSILEGGYSAIVDASFARRSDRARFRALAGSVAAKAYLIHCRAPLWVLRARIAARRTGAPDASEADEMVLERQVRLFERPSPDEGIDIVEVDSDDPGALANILRRIGAGNAHE